MTKAYNNLFVEYFCGDPKRCRLVKPLRAYCDTLGRDIEAPIGFINDMESTSIIKGTNNESGVWHDYFGRSDSDPVVSKWIDSRIYFEFQKYYDFLERARWKNGKKEFIKDLPNRGWDFMRRWFKSGVVLVAPRWYHRFKVMASYEEIVGCSEPKPLEE